MAQNTSDVADIKFSKRFSANLVTNIIYTAVNALIGVLLVPFFLNTLGDAAYGIIPVATSITSYVTIVVNALNTSVGRYLMFDLRASNVTQANQTFNTSLIIHIIIISVLIPISIIVAFAAPEFLSIGELASSDVTWLCVFVFGAGLLTILGAEFTLPLYAHNLFYIKNTLHMIQIVIQAGLIIIFFMLSRPSLILVGAAYIIAAAVFLVLSIIFALICCRELKLSLSFFSKKRFKELMSMSAWTLVQNGGLILRFNIGIVIVNIFCGLLAGTQYSIIISFYSLLIAIAATITTLFGPMIYSYVSNKDNQGLSNFCKISLKVCCLFTALMIGAIVIYAPEILTIWVGEDYAFLAPLVCLSLIPVYLYAPINFLSTVLVANLHHRQYGIIYCIAGVGMMILSAVFAIVSGIAGVLIAGIIISVICDFIVMIVYVSRLTKEKSINYYKNYLLGFLFFLVVIIIGFIVKLVLNGQSFLSLVIACIIISVISLPVVLKLFLRKDEKESIKPCLPKLLRKLI